MLGLSAVLFVALIGAPLRALASRTRGDTFLIVVATESLAVLAGELALQHRLQWLAVAALFPLVCGAGMYAVVLGRFRLKELRTAEGDHWITGGALAISALACGELARASAAIPALHGLHGILRVGTLVLWSGTIAWLPILIVCEIRWPRVRYDVRRWATVFPLGMYSAMSFTAAGALGAGGIGDFARACVWVALAAWLMVAAGAARRLYPLRA